MNPRSPSDLHLPTRKPEPRIMCACVVPSRHPPHSPNLHFAGNRRPKLAAIAGLGAGRLSQGRRRPLPAECLSTWRDLLAHFSTGCPDAVSKGRWWAWKGCLVCLPCPALATLADQARDEVAAALSILPLFATVLLKTAEAWEKLGSFVQC